MRSGRMRSRLERHARVHGSPGRGTGAAGVTGAAFEAVRPGIATITSARNPCDPASSHPPRPECGVVIEYRVTLVMTT